MRIGKDKIDWLLFLALFSLFLFLFLTTNAQIYPELFYYPELVGKFKMLPYRDFFDHHGPLLHYFLIPFSGNLFFIKIVFWSVLVVSFTLVFNFLKNRTAGLILFFNMVLFVLLVFLVSGQMFWYEHFLGFLMIVIFLLSNEKESFKNDLWLGLLFFLGSGIKPTFIVLLLLLFLTKKRWLMVFSFGLLWFFLFSFFFISDGFFFLWDNLFSFNSFYATYNINNFSFLIDKVIFLGILLISFLLFLFSFKKDWFLKEKKIVFFLIFSFFLIYPRFEPINLLPLSFFFPILIGFWWNKEKERFKKCVIGVSLFIFIFLLVKKTFRAYETNRKRPEYIKRELISSISYDLKNRVVKEDLIYVFGNQLELYYLLDKKLPVRYPIVLPWIKDYYPDLEKTIIEGLEKNNVNLVLIPLPLDKNYDSFEKVKKVISEEYFLDYKSENLMLYRKY